ncbi:MAG: CPBP family intramembrane metalloprotease [Planctomycetes bacterium]|nr:CPBP family intramembrane metalloprotease [Planctomycetota bacterium]
MNTPEAGPSSITAKADWSVVGFALAYPTVFTVLYFVALAKQPQWLQQAVYAVGKVVQFSFPLVWAMSRQGWRPRWQAPRIGDVLLGVLPGLLLLGVAVAAYHLWLKPAGLFAGPAEAVREKAAGFGVAGAGTFIALAVFYCLGHSALEEYYWRWFTFGQLRKLSSFAWAAGVSSVGFMAHHVLVLAVYFGWDSPLTYGFSLAVAVGGLIWALIYEKTGNLWANWLSHALIDAAIFVVGYDILLTTAR